VQFILLIALLLHVILLIVVILLLQRIPKGTSDEGSFENEVIPSHGRKSSRSKYDEITDRKSSRSKYDEITDRKSSRSNSGDKTERKSSSFKSGDLDRKKSSGSKSRDRYQQEYSGSESDIKDVYDYRRSLGPLYIDDRRGSSESEIDSIYHNHLRRSLNESPHGERDSGDKKQYMYNDKQTRKDKYKKV